MSVCNCEVGILLAKYYTVALKLYFFYTHSDINLCSWKNTLFFHQKWQILVIYFSVCEFIPVDSQLCSPARLNAYGEGSASGRLTKKTKNKR